MICVQNLTKRVGSTGVGSRALFDNLSYHFPHGERIALVGCNGCGKTSLLNILTGEDEPDAGTVIKPHACAVGYLPQEPNPHPAPTLLQEALDGAKRIVHVSRQRDEALAAMALDCTQEIFDRYELLEQKFQELGGYTLESKTKGILLGLGFEASQYDDDPKTLSGGWRMRLELVRTLIDSPDFLVLDEPTNHLDLPSLVWLEAFLKGYQGTVVFVSHDKDFINRLATLTLHLNQGHMKAYKGNFDAFILQMQQDITLALKQQSNLNAEYDHVRRFVERFRGQPSKSSQVASRKKMLERIENERSAIAVPQAQQRGMSLNLAVHGDKPRSNGKTRVMVGLTSAKIGYTTPTIVPILNRVDMKVCQGQKIAIIGANGLGKSTLLKTLAGVLPLLEGEREVASNAIVGYFSQDVADALDLKATALDNVLAANPALSEHQARSLLGGFGLQGTEVFKETRYFSGGEKSRISLSCLLATKPNVMLLDEPTNHLDMESIQALGEALSEHSGTLVFISHDRTFVNQVATHTYVVASRRDHQLFDGDIDAYLEAAASQRFPNIFEDRQVVTLRL